MASPTTAPRVFTAIPLQTDLPFVPGDIQIVNGVMQTYVGGGVWVTAGAMTVGNVYYVNNLTGSSSNNGLSWATAVDQVSTAVTLSEASRLALTNIYTRNAILIQGTGTAYTAITSLPNYTDIIGVGATPWGNGAGIVRIDGTTANVPAMTGASSAGEMRGSYFRNIRFEANGTACYTADFLKLFRTTFEDCSFMQDNTAGTPIGGFRTQGDAGGIILRRCLIGGDTQMFTSYGMDIEGPHWNNCLVEDCIIEGATAGVFVNSSVNNDRWTVFRRNTIGYLGGNSGISTYGIYDLANAGFSVYQDNRVIGATPISLAYKAAYRCANNITLNGSASHIVTAIT